MITLNDCKAFCDTDAATVARVARREHLPEILAIALVQSRLMQARPMRARHPISLAPGRCDTQRLAA